MDIITHIKTLLEKQTALYEQELATLTGAPSDLIATLHDHLEKRGKQLRPLLTMLSAYSCGMPENTKESNPIFKVAAAMELLHNATLLHDDVIDESAVRRGISTVNAMQGNKIAVIAGDYLLARVMQTLHEVDNPYITQQVDQAVEGMSLGELREEQACGNYELGTEEYMLIIRQKTATFMAACCAAGASLGTGNSRLRQEAQRFGMAYGMAFQMRDDLLDMQETALTGKPQGNDIKEHKVTLPLIFALQRTEGDTKKRLLALLQKEEVDSETAREAIAIVAASGAIEATKELIAKQVEEAKSALGHMPPSRYREALQMLAEQLSTTPTGNQTTGNNN